MQACPGCGATTEEAGRFCPACGAVLVESPSDDAAVAAHSAERGASLTGHTIGDFVIDAVIGGGSFGTVYRGRQLGLDRPVALKVPSHEIAADPLQARRFAREARAAARIVHPGVVAIYAVGELDDGRPYLAMQLIDGEPLDRILADGPVPALRALRIARNIASALSETHTADVVHRDLKPSNVMWRLDRNGDDRITLVDFGIAVCRPGNADATRLTTGGLIGTPHYMSPEQAHGEQVDARADLYALGCLLFELVTGETPFDGSGFEVLLAHLNHPVPRASERNARVPEVLDPLIERLLEKKPHHRPASADAVVAMIDEVIAELTTDDATGTKRSRSADRATRARSRANSPSPDLAPPRRRWLAVVAIGGIALAGAGFAVSQLRRGDDDAVETPASAEPVPGKLVSASGVPLRLISRDDGELIVRTLVPEVIHARVPVHAFLEIKTKLGSQFRAKQVVVTIEDPHHNASAQTAAMHRGMPGHYAFRHTFAEPGPYVVRIFPSETETVSTIDLDVVP
jgi:serine/threonine protein kinase